MEEGELTSKGMEVILEDEEGGRVEMMEDTAALSVEGMGGGGGGGW